jgi:hypothetical protein
MKIRIIVSSMTTYEQVILFLDCWSHLLCTIFARSFIVISYEHHTIINENYITYLYIMFKK